MSTITYVPTKIIVRQKLVALLQDELPAALAAFEASPLADRFITDDDTGLKFDDVVFVASTDTRRAGSTAEGGGRDSNFADVGFVHEVEIYRFRPGSTAAQDECIRTEAAILAVLNDNLGAYADEDSNGQDYWTKLSFADSEALRARGKQLGDTLAHALNLEVTCYCRVTRSRTGYLDA